MRRRAILNRWTSFLLHLSDRARDAHRNRCDALNSIASPENNHLKGRSAKYPVSFRSCQEATLFYELFRCDSGESAPREGGSAYYAESRIPGKHGSFAECEQRLAPVSCIDQKRGALESGALRQAGRQVAGRGMFVIEKWSGVQMSRSSLT